MPFCPPSLGDPKRSRRKHHDNRCGRVRNISKATRRPEGIVSAARTAAVSLLKRDARMSAFVPPSAARPVREALSTPLHDV
jgi:hypothetical protein